MAFETDGVTAPKAGDLSIITNWEGLPQCVIETRAVAILPFDQISKEFASAEGEGDGSLAYWRKVHWAYFGRECARIGKEPAAEMPVLCEHFEVVYSELHPHAA